MLHWTWRHQCELMDFNMHTDSHRNKYNVCACVGLYTYMYFPIMSAKMGGPRDNDTPGAVNIPSSMILVSKYYSPIKGTRSHVEVVDSRVRAGKNKISLKHLVVIERKYPKKMGFERAKEST